MSENQTKELTYSLMIDHVVTSNLVGISDSSPYVTCSDWSIIQLLKDLLLPVTVFIDRLDLSIIIFFLVSLPIQLFLPCAQQCHYIVHMQ